MNLIANWKDVFAKSWSIRLALLSAALSAIELALPLFNTVFPANIFAYASTGFMVAAAVARVIHQNNLSGPPQ